MKNIDIYPEFTWDRTRFVANFFDGTLCLRITDSKMNKKQQNYVRRETAKVSNLP